MRPKFVVGLLLLTLLALSVGLFLKQHTGGGSSAPADSASVATASPVPGAAAQTEAAPPSPPRPAPLPGPVSAALPPTPSATTNALTSDQLQDAVDAEVDRLYDLSMKDDPASLSNILTALTNSNREIREAAIESAKQFGSTDAIPALKAAANATENIQEKIAYLEAADFLTVPTLEYNGPIVPTTPEQIDALKKRKAIEEANLKNRFHRAPWQPKFTGCTESIS